MPAASNDGLDLVPRSRFESRTLELDFPGLEIGVAEYEEGPTGCTVFHFPSGASVATDVRGGSPGTIGGYEWLHAICLAGGSLYGLEASTGVAAELLARRGYAVGWTEIALVSGAIIFDYGPRTNAVYPDKELGRAALRAAREGVFPLGTRGAGRSATVGKTFEFAQGEPAGQGGAFRALGPTRLAVFTVVNAVGAIVDRKGQVVRGHLDRATGTRGPLVAGIESLHAPPSPCATSPATRRSRCSSRTSASRAVPSRSSDVRYTRRWRERSTPSTPSSTSTCSTPSQQTRSTTPRWTASASASSPPSSLGTPSSRASIRSVYSEIVTSRSIPFTTWGGPPSRSVMKQTRA